MATLYEITTDIAQRLNALQQRLDNEGIAPTEIEKQQILGLIEGNLTDKLINYGKFIKNQQSDIDGIDNEIKRLTAKKRTLQNHTEALKTTMLTTMQQYGIDRIDHPIMPIRLQTNSKATITIDDVNALPPEFQLIKIEPNKTALEKAIKNGTTFDGVTLEKGKHIRIG